ncbi:MAG: GspMb/PilO family protein [Pseudomonadota bacterium]
MKTFTFHNPTLVRRFGTILVVGTCILLVLLTLFFANVARGNYDDINDQLSLIARADRAETGGTDVAANTLYQAETPQLAHSQMQTDMQALAEQNQVQLEVIRADLIEPINGALRMSLTLNGVVFESQLGAFLSTLARHEPMIVVESITLRRARATNRNVDTRPLAVRLKLSGFTAP